MFISCAVQAPDRDDSVNNSAFQATEAAGRDRRVHPGPDGTQLVTERVAGRLEDVSRTANAVVGPTVHKHGRRRQLRQLDRPNGDAGSAVTRRSSRSGATALASALCLLLSGCVSQDLAFRVDKRLTITSPEHRSEVTLPVTVRWHIRDFEIVEPGETTDRPRGEAGLFAVLVDKTPQPPGKPLAWLARKDRTCRASDGCPDTAYLAARNIHVTSAQELTLDQLPRPSRRSRKERHRVTIILLDPTGVRLGESAFQIEFTVRREPSS
jgi:hypothetical protein